MLRTTLLLALVLALFAGTAACGGDDPTGSPQAPQSQATASAVPGLPADYPDEQVPVIRGVVTAQSGGTAADGQRGWVLEVSATGSRESCFADAAAALVAEGFVKQDELVAGDTTQAQYVSDEYAVIISARDDGDELCQVGYEVGEVSN